MARFRYDRLADAKPGDLLELDRTEASHLFKILRARPGETAGLLDGKGNTGSATVTENRMLRLDSVETIPFPHRRIHLYLAPPRRQKMDQLLKEAAELGVYRIVPMICERSVALPDADSADRQNDLLFEACKQSGNPYLPRLEVPVKFSQAVQDAAERSCLCCFGSPYESDMAGLENAADVAFFVGPEGGFSGQEEQQMRSAGFHSMRIGPWILRVETAAIAGIARLWAD